MFSLEVKERIKKLSADFLDIPVKQDVWHKIVERVNEVEFNNLTREGATHV